MSSTAVIEDPLQRADSYESCYNRGFFNLNGNQTLQEDGSSSISEIFLRKKNRSLLSLNGFNDCSSALFSIYEPLGDEPETPRTSYEQKIDRKKCQSSESLIRKFGIFLMKLTTIYIWGYSIAVFVFHVQMKQNIKSSHRLEILTRIPHFQLLYGIGMTLYSLLVPMIEFMRHKFLYRLTPKNVLNMEARKSKCMEISETIRVFSTFMGIVYAFAKLSWVLDIQTSLFLVFIGFSMWFIFDRTQIGLFFSSIISTLFTIIILYFTYDIFKNKNLISKEILGIKSWILGFLFSSCIAAANIGRRFFGYF
ncbi:hypothetical protein PCANB_000959 [Pneumocystis canis]|nr:hypothetical protein PCANB_000959 [Pneumocystis canis]